MTNLRFGGSVWCNIDVALRNIDAIYKQKIEPLDLTIVEWYIMRLLYEEDGQMASRLAEGTGRTATSFTPILDKLQNKGFIERRLHPADRRAIKIYLTDKGKGLEEQIKGSLEIDNKFTQQFSEKDLQAFLQVIESLQSMTP